MTYLFGQDPLFIFDPEDRSNEPADEGEGPLRSGRVASLYWPTYPEFCRDMFTKAFTIGLESPSERVTAQEWAEMLAAMRDLI